MAGRGGTANAMMAVGLRTRPNADGSIEAGGSTDLGTFDDPWRELAFPGLGRQIGLEREMSTFFYMLLAFVVGILVGWFIWGRLRGDLDSLRGDLDRTRSERDRLRADNDRLKGELDACG